MEISSDKKYLFESAKVSKAVFALALPTIISQLITIIYNWADTYFVGLLNNTYQIAALTICYPPFMICTSLANLIGIGGANVISRAMGSNNNQRIKKTSTVSMLYIFLFSIIYVLLIYFFKKPLLLNVLGADQTTIDYCYEYLIWVVVIGGLPTVFSAAFAHLIRSTGKSIHASIGITIGAVLNIILDPIFIFVFKMEVKGAAIATCISNIVSCLYFIVYFIITRKKQILDFHLKNILIKDNIYFSILISGLSSCLMTLMAVFSNASINKLMSSYSAAAISGVSIAKKVDLCIIAFAQGLANGILPLVAYNFASKNKIRMKKIISFSIKIVLTFSIICVILFSLFPKAIVSFFIKDSQTIDYASSFLRILCLSMPLTSLVFLFNTVFQATKQNAKALTTIVLRKGIIDIPLMIVLNILIPIYGVVMSQPIVDTFGAIVAITLYIIYLKQEKKQKPIYQ